MIIHGNNVILASTTSGIAFAAAKSCDLNVQAGTLETSSPTIGDWLTHIKGRKSWTANISHLVTEIKSNVQMVGQSVNITFGVRGSTTDQVTGTATIKQWKVTGTRGNLSQASIVLEGNGALT